MNGLRVLKVVAVSTAILTTLACSEDPNKTASLNTVATSLVITASSQAATVARYKPKLIDLIMPRAIALPAPSMVDASGATINLSSGWMVLKDIEFKLNETADVGEAAEGDELSFRGPYVVDLLSANPQPVESKNIAAASIRRIKFKLHEMENLPAGSPAELTGNSLYFSGTVAGVAFSFASRDGAEINVGGPTGVTPDANSDLLMAIQLASLIKKIDLSGITVATNISDSNRVAGTNLCPTIDVSANDLYTCFRKGIEQESKFGIDSDKSHEIEETENEVEDPAGQ